MKPRIAIRRSTCRTASVWAARSREPFGGDYAETVPLLRLLRSYTHRFGGSHAQRDLIDLAVIEAALRGGDAPLGRALAAERAATCPAIPLAQRFPRRAATFADAGDAAARPATPPC